MTGAESKQVVLAAGGTGGHLFPAQALARELLDRGLGVALITDHRGSGFGPDLPRVATYRISAGGLAGGSPLKRLKSVFSLALGFVQARGLIKALRPDAVVGFGGYASVPTTLAGARLGLRVVLHEQNAVLGRANRLLAPRAHAIAICFAEVENLTEADRPKVILTGNPVRPAIAALGRRPFALPGREDPLRLFVFGGSQGARAFNDLIPAAVSLLPEALRRRLAVAQQVPGDALATVEAAYRACAVETTLRAFFEDVPKRLAGAHLVISRAGASTVAELAAVGRPAILIPFPSATDDHQTANARALTEAGGGWLIPQSSITPEILAERLISLFAAPALLARAASCAADFAQDNAAGRLADVVCRATDSNSGSNSGANNGSDAGPGPNGSGGDRKEAAA